MHQGQRHGTRFHAWPGWGHLPKPPALVVLGVAAGAGVVLGAGADGVSAGAGVLLGLVADELLDGDVLLEVDELLVVDDDETDEAAASADSLAVGVQPGILHSGGVPGTVNATVMGGCWLGSVPGAGVWPHWICMTASKSWFAEFELSARNSTVWHCPAARR